MYMIQEIKLPVIYVSQTTEYISYFTLFIVSENNKPEFNKV